MVCCKLLFLCFMFSVSGTCLYESFNNTSVTLSGVKGGIKKITGCFSSQTDNSLHKVSLIQIINETVPTLYEGAFNNLQNLVDIVIERVSLHEIRPGAFKNLPKLYLIKVKYNNIHEIREGVFNYLNISELLLVDNNIELVQSGAFNYLPNLSIINLGYNKLKTWESEWFMRTSMLTVVNFEHNYLTELPEEAFKNINGLHVMNNKINISTSIHLNNNKIRIIQDGAFAGANLTTLGWLFLQHNLITEFNANSLGNLKQIDWLRLDYNNLSCIPEKLTEIASNVIYYLSGNPLSETCREKFNIKNKNNVKLVLNKFNISVN